MFKFNLSYGMACSPNNDCYDDGGDDGGIGGSGITSL